MIRAGKSDGWLRNSQEALKPWATLNGCAFNKVTIDNAAGKGLAVLATSQVDDGSAPLITVPRDLVLSKDTVRLHAQADKHFRDVIEALGDFGQTSRGAILTFLLFHSTRLCPEVDGTLGVSNQLAEYIKFLPTELLPTFWTQDELELLEGTSLAPAVEAKLNSLHREYDQLCSATRNIDWCQKYWWDEADGLLSFDDWKQVDAFYRSRALESPGIGDAMVPVIDMANHASGDDTKALYESDATGNASLILRQGKQFQQSDEITITYGDEKGACEMIFSYGFLEEGMSGARDIFLDLDIPDDDPLKQGKKMVSSSAPGVRLYQTNGYFNWESDFLWLICVNEEDGLRLELAQTTAGDRELQQFWRDAPIDSNTQLKRELERDERWDLFHLRAVSILQNRVEQQLTVLYGNNEDILSKSKSAAIRDRPRCLALSLRELEGELLEQFYEHFEQEKLRLANTDTVQSYLKQMQDKAEDDFS